jgi:hypothetical protein
MCGSRSGSCGSTYARWTWGELFNQPVLDLLRQFEEATTFGSLIQPVLGEREIKQLRRQIEVKELGGELFLSDTHQKVLVVLEQAEYLTQRYHVAVANPPYMGSGNMSAAMKAFATTGYSAGKADLSAMFGERCLSALLSNGWTVMVTMHNWMFLSSFEGFRREVVLTRQIESCVHIGLNGFPELNSKVVQTVAFVLSSRGPRRSGVFFNLADTLQQINMRYFGST